MAGYIPNYLKKRLLIRGREEKLHLAIRKGLDEIKLLKAAAAVQEARISALRAQRGTLVAGSLEELDAKRAKVDARIALVRAMVPQSVLAEFRSSKTKLKSA